MATRLPGFAAAALVAGVAVLYIAIIRSQGEIHEPTVVAGFAGALVAAAAGALAAALARDPYWRRLGFGISAAITFVCMVLSGLSIGPLLIPALFLLIFSVIRG